jgi:hypothetical protein
MHLFFTANDYSFSYPKDTFDCVVAIAYRKIRRNKRISINKEHGKSRVFHALHPSDVLDRLRYEFLLAQ